MTRSRLRTVSRLLGVLFFGVCFVLVLNRAQTGSSLGATAQGGSSPRPAAVADATTAVPGSLAGPHALLSTSSAPFAGLPTVGAVFGADGQGRSDHQHYCSGSVVDSPGGGIVVTAAHCVVDPTSASPSTARIVFVPGYHDGKEPFGEWVSQRVVVDPRWTSGGDPDYDVAFVTVADAGSPGARLTDLVGAQRIDFAAARPARVAVIGYPGDKEQPIACLNTLTAHSATQSEFDCAGYSDGTSGGPMLADLDPVTGRGTLIGVIGGYQDGGDSPDVSYSCYFGDAAKALYLQAQAAG